MRNFSKHIAFLNFLFLLIFTPANSQEIVTIGSKNFPESRVLGEVMAQLIEAKTDYAVQRKWGLGGTLICFEALRNGDIDIYPEYTGTGATAILNAPSLSVNPDSLFAFVQRQFRLQFQIEWLAPFGFNNTYAIVVSPEIAANTLTELAAIAGEIRAGFSHEFLNRPDGYPGLAKTYRLKFGELRGMEHGLAYQAIAAGEIDLTDAYSTDGKLEKYHLKALADDKHFFPPYFAAPMVRIATLKRLPKLAGVLKLLDNRISEAAIRQMNLRVEVLNEPFATVARDFLVNNKLIENTAPKSGRSIGQIIAEKTAEHLFLTFLATFLAVLVGVPVGIALPQFPKFAAPVLGFASIVQTIPSLAILGLMIPLFGIGTLPAIIALFLYALLPVLRNTYSGIRSVDPKLKEAGTAMGMTRFQRLWMLELPVSTGFIMARIRTATVINIGTATLAAFIGAGGLGELIITGITLNDKARIMQGAIPAALLALLMDFLLANLEKKLTPKGLQIGNPDEKI